MPRRTGLSLALLFLLTLSLHGAARAQSVDRAQAAADIESLREQLKAREAILLAPSAEDLEAHAAFLGRPRTGLVRLLPREKWDGKLSMRGGGAYYSFTRKTHEYGYGSDISLEQDQLSVGFAGADHGYLVILGDVPLEALTAETDGVRYLAGLTAPTAEPEARAAYRRSGAGFEAEGRTYRSRMPAVARQTYALRSVNYGNSDVLVAFRVVRKDADGSVLLLWKLVKKYPRPTLDSGVAASAP